MAMVDYSRLPEHMQGGARRYIERGISPGHFLTAVLSNDFLGAFKRADDENIERMKEWARWLYNECPREAHGSPEAVEEWIAAGGMEGLIAAREAHEDREQAYREGRL
jgi:hypothetical protein